MPSVLGAGRAAAVRARCGWLASRRWIEREIGPCCYAATAAEICERSDEESTGQRESERGRGEEGGRRERKREAQPCRNEREESDSYDYYSRAE
jgi:hypothetical protein